MGDKLIYEVKGELPFEIHSTDKNSFKLIFPKCKTEKEVKEIASAINSRKVSIIVASDEGLDLSIKVNNRVISAAGESCKELFRILNNLHYITPEDHVKISRTSDSIDLTDIEDMKIESDDELMYQVLKNFR